LPGFLRV